MKEQTKITFFDDGGGKFFGDGPCRLLRGVEECGSLRGAAISMGMAYTKALKIVNTAEKCLGFPLMIRSVGGRSGGGSSLTEKGREWLCRYEAYRNACVEEDHRRFLRHFPEGRNQGCVIMASGLGKRFGSNKLMADFGGRPMIQSAVEATEGLFSRRVVVTRHASVEKYCQERKMDVILHDLPHRSDTIRLGLEAIGGSVDGCIFLPGDQPLLSRQTVNDLSFTAAVEPREIHRSSFGEAVGMPVYFPQWSFDELCNLPEGKGGGVVIRKYPDRVRLFPVENRWELADADTPEQLAELLTRRTNDE